MAKAPKHVVNVDDVEEIADLRGRHWGGYYKPLTPALDPYRTRDRAPLGVGYNRVPPGRSFCPFHSHELEDEVFYVLSGRGLFRYGDTIREVGPGDCMSCPAGTGVAHQLANPFDEDFVYLGIGANHPHEVCVYPDSGKVNVRSLRRVGYLEKVDYFHGEADPPRLLALAPKRRGSAAPAKSSSRPKAAPAKKAKGKTRTATPT
jgi:uncharacterized cupin superfamily protein